MVNEKPAEAWHIDLAASLASCGSILIRFNHSDDRGLDIAFVAGGDCSLEEQCLIAGEATAAIQTKLGSVAAPN